jgi:hypothetical protein
MVALTESGTSTGSLAYNDVSLLRQTRQAAHIGIDLNGQERVAELIGDGVLVATPAGSTAYNYSAHGPVLPLGSHTIALTPLARTGRGGAARSSRPIPKCASACSIRTSARSASPPIRTRPATWSK